MPFSFLQKKKKKKKEKKILIKFFRSIVILLDSLGYYFSKHVSVQSQPKSPANTSLLDLAWYHLE